MAEKVRSSNPKLPNILTALPGPKAQKIIDSDHHYISPSYTRSYPLVVEPAHGAMVEDVDENRFLELVDNARTT